MSSKLTLSLDKDLIEQAKVFAKSKGRSLSSLIENYLKVVVKNEKELTEMSPALKKLKGSVKLPENFDYKKGLQDALSKKHGA